MSPTFDRTDNFKHDYQGIGEPQRTQILDSLGDFIADLTAIEEGQLNHFRPGLRVKPMRARPGIWEMTWDGNDGRATFEYGPAVTEGKRHVVWRRIGGHDIFGAP